jgi:hypothetical protein
MLPKYCFICGEELVNDNNKCDCPRGCLKMRLKDGEPLTIRYERDGYFLTVAPNGISRMGSFSR